MVVTAFGVFKAAGGRVAPDINSALGDAVRSWHADGRYWFVPDTETVEDWVAQRKWWDVADQASDWKAKNSVHLQFFDKAILRWKDRLGIRNL